MSETINVLIIEDYEDDAMLILRSLRHGGFVPIWQRVQTVKELVEALKNCTWDVVISDYNLPELNAPRALEIVREICSHLPFIVVSGTIGEALAVELMIAGANDYLMKGSLTRLPEAVRRELREAKMRIERIQAAIELDQIKERLQLALEGSAIGLWDWAVQTGELTINEQWAQMLGYTVKELEPISFETWQSNAHPEDLRQTLQVLEQLFRQEIHAYEVEMRMRHKQGDWIWVLSKGKVTEWDDSGKPLRMIGTHLDISDRKQAELRLSIQSQILERIAKAESLSTILEALVLAIEEQIDRSLCSILLCDRQGKLHLGSAPHLPKEYSQAIEGLSIGEGVGSCCTAAFRREIVIVSDIATDPLWQNFKELALGCNLRSCWSYPIITSDGEVLATFAVYYQAIHRPTPQELQIVALATDIAKIAIERDRVAQALEQLNQQLEVRVEERTNDLRQSEAKLLEAQQIAHLGSWEIDVKTKEIKWSVEIFNIFGIEPNFGEPTYEQLLQYFPPDERERFHQLVDRAIQFAEPYATDFKIIRADGSSGYIFTKSEVLCDVLEKGTRLFGITMDISDRKAMQEALKLSEERSRATLLALPDLVFRVNCEGKYLDFLASPDVGNLVEPDQVIGKKLGDCLPIEIWEREFDAIKKALDTKCVQSYEQEIMINGSLHFEELRVAPCGNDEVVFFIRDISDRKRAEIQLQKTNEELIRATRLKDEFLANMSHELRTPLNAVLGMSEALQDGVFGSLNDKQIGALETVERSGTHLLSLINDILDVAKIESGQIELDRTSTSIEQLCQTSLAFVKQLAYQKHIEIKVQIPVDLPNLILDERRIRQVLINLLNNAVKFTPDGGSISLEVSFQNIFKGLPFTELLPETILAPDSDYSQRENYLQIAVIDTGIGISPENITRLFKPFVQIDGALNRQYMGTGLGLAIVKQIVELHGGKVGAISKIGEGSCFTIALPIPIPIDSETSMNSLSNPQLKLNHKEQPKPKSPLILLVQDNEANIGSMSSYLEAKGYRLILARNGQDVISLTKSNNPDVILVDIQMSSIDGIEVTKQIRRNHALESIPIIALTDLSTASDRQKCLASGANKYLAKPVKLKQLTDTIQNLLSC